MLPFQNMFGHTHFNWNGSHITEITIKPNHYSKWLPSIKKFV